MRNPKEPQWSGPLPRRSGYFGRTVDTLYGRIRATTGLLDWAAYLYVMGLSLRTRSSGVSRTWIGRA